MVSPTDPQALLESVVAALESAAPQDSWDVERDRGLADRLAGRPGRTTSVEVRGPALTLTLTADGRGRLAGRAAHVVRGVTISRRDVEVGGWLALLAEQLHALAALRAADDAAVGEALTGLGVRGPGDDVVVPESDVLGGLRALPSRLAGRVPDDVAATVGRICELLAQALPRVAGHGDQAFAVQRAATRYLPDTLRAYLALPAEWARTAPVDGTRTSADALRDQVAALEQAARGMLDAALADDATALLANGRFLADRFPKSSELG